MIKDIPSLIVIQKFSTEHHLTPREEEIVVCLLQGQISNDEIGRILDVSPFTVSNHIKNILTKTKASSKTEVLARFINYMVDAQYTQQMFSTQPRLLVVDDESNLTTLISEEFEERGFKCYRANCVDAAIKLLLEHRIDIVLSDIRMPERSGYELLKEIKEKICPVPPVLLMSGFVNPGQQIEQWPNIVGFLDKPIDFMKLFQLVCDTIGGDLGILSQTLRCNQPTQLHLADRDLPAQLTELNPMGAFVSIDKKRLKECGHQLSPGNHIRFDFDLGEALSLKAKVLWLRPKSYRHLPSGVQLEFVDIDESTQQKIRGFMRDHRLDILVERQQNQAAPHHI